MATTPIPITDVYTKQVDAAVDPFTWQVLSDLGAEVVFVAAAPAETLEGVFVAQYKGVSRDSGSGHVYARVPRRPGAQYRQGRAVLLT